MTAFKSLQTGLDDRAGLTEENKQDTTRYQLYLILIVTRFSLRFTFKFSLRFTFRFSIEITLFHFQDSSNLRALFENVFSPDLIFRG